MDSPPQLKPASPVLPLCALILGSGLIGLSAIVVGIAGYFRLSPETAALRESVETGVHGTWDKKIALNVGFITTGLVRAGSSFFNLPAEPRAVLDAVRSGEVGIYKLQDAAGWVDHRAILARADREMSARRWDRVVGVSRENELVAVYCPRKGLSSKRLACCVLVLQGRDLILAGGSANPEPLLRLAEQQGPWVAYQGRRPKSETRKKSEGRSPKEVAVAEASASPD